MNAEIESAEHPSDKELLDLGTEFDILLHCLLSNRVVTGYSTIEQITAALEATTTLRDLTILSPHRWGRYPLSGDYRLRIAQLCRCIANLRRHNENHPLRRLKISNRPQCPEQFLVAAKQYGISELRIDLHLDVPVQSFMQFCYGNRHLKVLELANVSFALDSDAATATTTTQNYRSSDPSVSLHLDKLLLHEVALENSTAAIECETFLGHVKVSALDIGYFGRGKNVHLDRERMDSIVSKFKFPAVERLTLSQNCRIEHFKTILEAGVATMTHVTAWIGSVDEDDSMAKMQALTHMIHRAVQLHSFTSLVSFDLRPKLSPPLVDALEACATITSITEEHYFTRVVLPQLQRITDRNLDLARFLASPSIYPIRKLPSLMLQLEKKCPSGLYMLARRLPEVQAFEHLALQSKDSLTEKPEQKKRTTAL